MQPGRRVLLIALGGVLVAGGAFVAGLWVGSDDPPADDQIASQPTTAAEVGDPATSAFENNAAATAQARLDILGRSPSELLTIGEPLPTFSRTFDAVVADFDGDGRDDIQLSRHHASRFAPEDADGVWLASGDGYRLSFQLKEFRDRHGCAAGDVDGDGLTDLYCTIGASKGATVISVDGDLKTKANELLINTGNGSFVNRTEEWGVADPSGRGRDAMLFDYDNDGRLDLYLLNEYDRTDDRRSENLLFRNEGDRFVEVEGTALTGEHGYDCTLAMDWNQDGWTDVVVCRGGQPKFFENDAGTFVDVTETVIGERKSWQHVVAADLDGDGDQDLAVVRKAAVEIWRWNENTGKFKQINKLLIDGQGQFIAVGDFYGDDALDVFVLTAGVDCVNTEVPGNNDHDYLLVGPDFTPYVRATHGFGCGDRAFTLDGNRLLILNGKSKSRGPIEVADLRVSTTPLAPLPSG